MSKQKEKGQRFFRAVRIAKAVSTLAVVALPVATAVGAIAGYGVYFLFKSMRKAK